jgi:hypothetical protein
VDFRRRRRSGARPCPKNSVTMAVLPLSVMLFLVACAQGLTLVPISAQLELTLPLSANLS